MRIVEVDQLIFELCVRLKFFNCGDGSLWSRERRKHTHKRAFELGIGHLCAVLILVGSNIGLLLKIQIIIFCRSSWLRGRSLQRRQLWLIGSWFGI